jgi:hypothetical protein
MTRPALYSDSSIRTVYAIYVVNTSLVKTSVKTALQIADGRSGGIRRANMRATVLLSLLSIGSAPVSPPSPPPPRTCDHHCASCDGTSCTNCVTANHGCTCAPPPRSPPVDAAIADALLAADGNQFYRNPDYDTVHATKVADGAITLDGDLSDWDGHAHQYRDVAFATVSGDEVIFATPPPPLGPAVPRPPPSAPWPPRSPHSRSSAIWTPLSPRSLSRRAPPHPPPH